VVGDGGVTLTGEMVRSFDYDEAEEEEEAQEGDHSTPTRWSWVIVVKFQDDTRNTITTIEG
jgi:hypothetical protein